MKILLVEDEVLTADTIRDLIETTRDHQVVAVADDLSSAIAAADDRAVDLALVDLNLAHESTGFEVVNEMKKRNIPCIFISGGDPPFPMPELALGWLSKPLTIDTLTRMLDAVSAGDEGPGRRALWLNESTIGDMPLAQPGPAA